MLPMNDEASGSRIENESHSPEQSLPEGSSSVSNTSAMVTESGSEEYFSLEVQTREDVEEESEEDGEQALQGEEEEEDDVEAFDDGEMVIVAPPVAVPDEERVLDRDIDYDIAIPSRHSYLEMRMQRVEGYNYWLEGTTVPLFLLPLDVIAIPGQTLPLRIKESSLQYALVRHLLDQNQNTFGAVHMPAERAALLMWRSWSQCGVTVQILEVSHDSPQQIVLKCKCRQRFKTISAERQADRSLRASVVIRPDLVPCRITDPAGRLRREFEGGGWPEWVWKLHDPYTIEEKIRCIISKISPHINLSIAPTDPLMFSYWLISSMPFNFDQRVAMLHEDSLVVRLISQLQHLERNQLELNYYCAVCSWEIISSAHLISMSTDSPFYVNPSGHVFETITAYSLSNTLTSPAEPTERDSWFPGYAWTFINCWCCLSHLGWKFIAVSPDTTPSVFYGVTRSAVTQGVRENRPRLRREDLLDMFARE